LYERFMRIKQWKLLRPFLKKNGEKSKTKSLFQIFFNL
jgi:hypothetical protein